MLELKGTLLRSEKLSRTGKEDIYPLLNDICNREILAIIFDA